MNAGVRIILIIIVAAVIGYAKYSARSAARGSRGSGYTTAPGRDDVVNVGADDPRMAAAMNEARSKWDKFVKAFEEHKPERSCSIKAFFKGKRGGGEHMWVTVTALEGRKVRGVLANDPVGDVGKKQGDEVLVNTGDVEDWVYWDGKKMVGGFTDKVLEEVRDTGK